MLVLKMQALLQQVFSNRYNDKNYLEEIIEAYPYFTLAHLALLQQFNKNERSYDDQLAKTAIHFNNAPLLHLLLNHPTNNILPEIVENKVQKEDAVNMETEPAVSNIPIPATENKETNIETLADETPLFEPLYTTDYFASQGIKLSEEKLANDKLGRQLKSFTEWLKTMKKVHPGQKVDSIVIDASVEKLAEKSNEDAEIVTEAMAEVYESQGKFKKAKEIYQKLSLQNPAKSAFFAAKLEQIKDH